MVSDTSSLLVNLSLLYFWANGACIKLISPRSDPSPESRIEEVHRGPATGSATYKLSTLYGRSLSSAESGYCPDYNIHIPGIDVTTSEDMESDRRPHEDKF